MNVNLIFATVWSTMLTTASPLDARPGAERKHAEFRPNVTVAETYCEYAVNLLGIDVVQPRFTWVLACDHRGTMQQSYRVLVANSPARLAADTGDLWDSGQVRSDESVNVACQGAKLSSRQECFWKVRVWDDKGHVSPWSEPATFETGLLEPADWHGWWIGLGGLNAVAVSPLLRKQFVADGEVKRARLYAAGVGWTDWQQGRGPRGMRIVGLAEGQPPRFEHSYLDENHEPDVFKFPRQALIASLAYIGDTPGEEAGARTGVRVRFHPVRVMAVPD
ncbi:MAG: hypothetical protein JXQ73_08995 [Phycisphaerae bacterium]|nr:hypothetical protein [Phycisphaerae bacterium]